jgi:hypothetical protein
MKIPSRIGVLPGVRESDKLHRIARMRQKPAAIIVMQPKDE